MSDVALRPLVDADLDALFAYMRDPEAIRMAASTAEDPDDRAAFDAHRVRIRANPTVTYANARAAEIEETVLRLDGPA